MTPITIEELRPEHFPLAAKWLSTDGITKWLTAEWRNRSASPSIIAVAVRSRKNRLFLVRHGDTPCGLVGLADIDLADRTAMLWYLLGDNALAGQGITSGAVRQLADMAFQHVGLVSIYAWIMEDNLASRRVLTKCGFAESGRLRKATCSNGRQVDRVYFDLLSPRCGIDEHATAGGVGQPQVGVNSL
jgi:RimJ/RimL family protein N-acetyltransferase